MSPVPADPYNFVAGTPASADQVDARFAPLYATLNGAIDDTNVSAGGITRITAPTWTAATLTAPFTNPGLGNPAPGYAKTAAGLVVLRGRVRSQPNSNSTILTLPAGHRPTGGVLVFPAPWWDGASRGVGEITVDTSGNVVSSSGNSFGYMSLDAVAFVP